jgi:Ca2+-binding RTX toxin-like protein
MTALLETLESRTLYTAALNAAGVLTIIGTANRDLLSVDQTATSIIVSDEVRHTRQTFPAAKVKVINMAGLGGNDMLVQADRVTRPGKLDGGPGNDFLQGGRGRNQFVSGGGNDGISYMTRAENLNITLDGRANDGAAGENDTIGSGFGIVFGGKGNDRIVGCNQTQGLFGNDGNDTLVGAANHDLLVGGNGDDVLIGNASDDALSGGPGDDVLDGGTGMDTLAGEAGRDTIRSRDNQRDQIDGGLDPTIYDRDEVLDTLPRSPRSGVKM